MQEIRMTKEAIDQPGSSITLLNSLVFGVLTILCAGRRLYTIDMYTK